jgi:3-oxoacyl-(acyl-carrier-protein) synthase
MKRRVVITGIGIQSPLGSSANEFFTRLCAGVSGIRQHPDPAIAFPVGWVDFMPSKHFSKMQLLNLDRVSQLAVVAALDAVRHAGLDVDMPFGDQTGVYLGTGAGGAESLEHAYAKFFGAGGEKKKLLTVPAAMLHAPASQIALRLGVRGECQTYSTACSSAAVAIGEAYRRIKDGYMQTAIAGGADCVLMPGVLDSWQAMRVLCDSSEGSDGALGKGCKPFSLDRTGFAIGEGAAVFALETLESATVRSAVVLAEIVGYGVSNDASHLTKPNSEGQAVAMRHAISDAGLQPEDIGHINAHGTATAAGDVAETESIKAVFGKHAYNIGISATKSAHGHLMGATGAVELVAMVMALQTQTLPPTSFYGKPDPDCDLDYVPNVARQVKDVDYALSNSFAFGGNNAALIVRRWTEGSA